MTAIGAFTLSADLTPIVVGDLAVSGIEPEHEVFVPTRGTTSDVFAREPGFPGYVVQGCVQKVVICHDRLVVAWAGSRIAAQAVLRELSAIPSPDVASLAKVIAEQDDSEETQALELLGFLAEPHDAIRSRIRGFHVKGRELIMPTTGALFRGGGAEQMARAFAGGPSWMSGAPQPGATNVGQILGAIGQLMNLELTTLQPLLRYFGGGYEVAFWEGKRFIKMESAVHLFWRVIMLDDRRRFSPVRIVRPTYVGPTLVVHAANTGDVEPGAAQRLERYLITAPHVGVPTNLDPSPVRFAGAPWVCSHFLLEDGEGKIRSMFSRIQSGPSPGIRIGDTDDGFSLEIDDAVFAEVAEFIPKALGAQAKSAEARRRSRNQRKRARKRSSQRGQ